MRDRILGSGADFSQGADAILSICTMSPPRSGNEGGNGGLCSRTDVTQSSCDRLPEDFVGVLQGFNQGRHLFFGLRADALQCPRSGPSYFLSVVLQSQYEGADCGL